MPDAAQQRHPFYDTAGLPELNPISYLNISPGSSDAEHAHAARRLLSVRGIEHSGDFSEINSGIEMQPREAYHRVKKIVTDGLQSVADRDLLDWDKLDPNDISGRADFARSKLGLVHKIKQGAGELAGLFAGSASEVYDRNGDEYKNAPEDVRAAVDWLSQPRGEVAELSGEPAYLFESEDEETKKRMRILDDYRKKQRDWRDIAAYDAKLNARYFLRQYGALKPLLSAQADQLVQRILSDEPFDDDFRRVFEGLPAPQQDLVLGLGRNAKNSRHKNLARDSWNAFATQLVDIPKKAWKEIQTETFIRPFMDGDDYQQKAETKARLSELLAPKMAEYGYAGQTVIGFFGTIPYMGYAMLGEAGFAMIAASAARDFKHQIALDGGDVSSPESLYLSWAAGIAYAAVERAQVGILKNSMTDIEKRYASATLMKNIMTPLSKKGRSEISKVIVPVMRDGVTTQFRELTEEVVQKGIEQTYVSWGVDGDIARETAAAMVQEAYDSFGVMGALSVTGIGISGAHGAVSRTYNSQHLMEAFMHRAKLMENISTRDKLIKLRDSGQAYDQKALTKAERDIDSQRNVLRGFMREYRRAGTDENAYNQFMRMGLEPMEAAAAVTLFRSEYRAIMEDPNLSQAEKEAYLGKDNTVLNIVQQAYQRDVITENPDGSYTRKKQLGDLSVIEDIRFDDIQFDPNSPAAAASIVEELNALGVAMTVEEWLKLPAEEKQGYIESNSIAAAGSFTLSSNGAEVSESQLKRLYGVITLRKSARKSEIFHEDFHAFIRYQRVSGKLTSDEITKLRNEFGAPRAGVNEDFNEEAAANAFREYASGKVSFVENTPLEKVVDNLSSTLGRMAAFRKKKDSVQTTRQVIFDQILRGEYTGIPMGTVSEAQRQENASKQKRKPEKSKKQPAAGQNMAAEPQKGQQAIETPPQETKAAEAQNGEISPAPGEWRSYTPDGKHEVEGQLVTVALSDLISSSDPRYPQSLHPRDVEGIGRIAQVHNMSRNYQLRRIVGGTDTSAGYLVIDPSGNIISGNGRYTALVEALKNGTLTRAELESFMSEEAAKHGLSVLDGMENFIVAARVEKLPPGLTMEEFAELSNRNAILQRNPSEQAEADSIMILERDLIQLFRPGGDGNVLASSNSDFLNAFVRMAGDDSLMDSSGNPTEDFGKRIKRAMLALAVGRGDGARDTIRALVENAAGVGMKREVDGVMKAAGDLAALSAFKPEYSLMDELAQALREYLQMKLEEKTAAEWLGQKDIFYIRPKVVEMLISEMDRRRTAAGISAFLHEYTVRAGKIDTTTGDLFGEKNATKEKVLQMAIDATEAEAAAAQPRYSFARNAPKPPFGEHDWSRESAPPGRNIARVRNGFLGVVSQGAVKGNWYEDVIQVDHSELGYSGLDDRFRYYPNLDGGYVLWQFPNEVSEESRIALQNWLDRNKLEAKTLDGDFGPINNLPLYSDSTQKNTGRRYSFTSGANSPIIAPAFFSQLRRVIEAKMPNRASVQQIRGLIDPQKGSGIKSEELYWSGLQEFLDSKKPDDMVTKDEVLAATRDVVVRDVVKGFGLYQPDQIQERPDGRFRVWAESNRGFTDAIVDTRSEAEKWLNDRDHEGYGEATKFGSYQLPGGENYRELLLTLPVEDSQQERDAAEVRKIRAEGGRAYRAENSPSFRSSHFSEPNILAHVRFNERTDADGKRILFIEEVQSDWHQAGKKRGYQHPINFPSYEEWMVENISPEFQTAEEESNNRQMYAIFKKNAEWTANSSLVPDAPFKDTSKGWARLALKRMIRWAAENSFDRIAWTTGAQQAARYDLSKQVDNVRAFRREDGTFDLSAKSRDGSGPHDFGNRIAAERIADYVGKDLAEKITKQPEGWHTYEGQELKVGGEGMIAFYDKILPNIANDLGKKFGAKVKNTELTGEGIEADAMNGEEAGTDKDRITVWALPITPTMRDSVLYEGQPRFSMDSENARATRDALDSIEAVVIKKIDTGMDYLKSVYKSLGIMQAPDGSRIIPVRDAFRKIYRHNNNELLLYAVPEFGNLISRSVLGFYANDLNKTRHSNVDKYKYYISKLAYAGREHFIRFTVKALKDGNNNLHDAIITDAEIIRAADARPSRFIALATGQHQSGSYDAKLHDWWHSVNRPGPSRHSFDSTRSFYSNNSRAIGSLAVRHLTGQKISTEDAEKVIRWHGATGITPDQAIAKAKEYASGKVAETARAALNSTDPTHAITVIAREAEFESIMEHAVGLGVRSGTKMGVAATRAEDAAIKRVLKDVPHEDLQAFTIDTGMDIAASMLDYLPEEFDEFGSEISDKARYEQWLKKQEERERVTREATPEELAVRATRFRNLLDAVQAKHAQERAAREKRMKSQKVEKQEETDLDAAGRLDPDEPLFVIPEELLKAYKVDLRSADEVSSLLRMWIGDWIVRNSGGRLNHQTVWKDLEAVETYRKTLVAQLQDIARKLIAPEDYSLDAATRMIKDLPSNARPNTLETRAAHILGFIQRNAVRQSRKHETEQTDKMLKEMAVQGRDFDKLKEDYNRKVPAEYEASVRYLRFVIGLSEAGVEAETKRLQNLIDQKGAEYLDIREAGVDRDIEKDVNYRLWITQLNLLNRWGGLKNELPAEIIAQREEMRKWLILARERLFNRWQELAANNARLEQDLVNAVIPANPDQAVFEGNMADKFALSQTASLRERLDLIIRFSKDENTRASAARAIDEIMHVVNRGSVVRENLLKQFQTEWQESLLEIVGSRLEFGRYMKRLEKPAPAELTVEISKKYKGTMPWGVVLQLYVSMTQRNYADNVVHNGRKGQAALIEQFMTANDMKFVRRLRDLYEARREMLDQPMREVTGMGVWRPDPLYMPVQMDTGSDEGLGVVGSVKAWNPFSKSLSPRVRHKLDFDESVSIQDMYFQRAIDTANAVAFGVRGLTIRGVLGKKNFKDVVERYHGKKALREMLDQATQTMTGLPSGIKTDLDKIARWARNSITYIYLSGNVGSGLKQTVSIPVFALRIGVPTLLKAISDSDADSRRAIMESEEYRARYGGGINPEVAEIWNDTSQNPIKRLARMGMTLVQMGDFVPSLIVAPGLYKAKLQQYLGDGMEENLAKERAMSETWDIIESTQQSSRIQNMPAYYRDQNQWLMLLLQFGSAPRQQFSHQATAYLEWRAGVPGARNRLIKNVVINHIVMPALMGMVGGLIDVLLGNEPDDDENVFMANLLQALLLGPYAHLVIVGSLLEWAWKPAVTGKRTWGGGGLIPAEYGLKTIAEDAGLTIGDILSLNLDELHEDLIRLLIDSNAPGRMIHKAVKNRR